MCIRDRPNSVTILSDTAIREDDLDEERAKKAEASAASDIEAAEKEQVSARNKVPIDQENLLKKAKDSATSKSQKEIDAATGNIESQKSDILKKGKKSNSDMKKKAEGKVDAAADKFIKEFLESLS